MRRHPDLESAARAARAAPARRVATVGYFDGLHVGHQALLRELGDWARALGGESLVVTFDRHPQEVLSGSRPLRLLSAEHKLLLLERLGISAAITLPFTKDLSLWTAHEFVERVIRQAGGASHLLMGFDAAFGHRRQGTFEYLAERAGELGIEVRRAEPRLLGGERVSSTLVRSALVEGDLPRLEALLGRAFSVLGLVVEGDRRGKKLGFPTANLDLLGETPPRPGVYFAEARVLGEPPDPPSDLSGSGVHGALVNVGRRPTFEGSMEIKVESHLVDFEGDLYGKWMEVSFLARHREEMKFPSADALVGQIRRDVEEYRAWRGRR